MNRRRLGIRRVERSETDCLKASPKGKRREVNPESTRRGGRIKCFEPIELLWQAIRAWMPADDVESETAVPERWDQTTGTGWKAPGIDPGVGRTLVMDYT